MFGSVLIKSNPVAAVQTFYAVAACFIFSFISQAFLDPWLASMAFVVFVALVMSAVFAVYGGAEEGNVIVGSVRNGLIKYFAIYTAFVVFCFGAVFLVKTLVDFGVRIL
jgi:hypothetical protein